MNGHPGKTVQKAPPKILILIALADGALHGYAIFDQIVSDTVGLYVRKTTLYRALAELERDGLVAGESTTDHASARTYHLTAAGRRFLHQVEPLYERLAQLLMQRLH